MDIWIYVQSDTWTQGYMEIWIYEHTHLRRHVSVDVWIYVSNIPSKAPKCIPKRAELMPGRVPEVLGAKAQRKQTHKATTTTKNDVQI